MFGSSAVKLYSIHRKQSLQVICTQYRLLSAKATLNNSLENSLKNAKPFLEIPAPKMLPFIGSAWQFLPIIGPYNILKQHLAFRHKRQLFGDVWREKLGPLNAVISYHPKDMETLLRNEGPYPSRGEFTCLKAYRESRKQWYKSTGLLILEGTEWQDLRKKTQKHLMKPKAIEAYIGSMQDVAGDFVKRILEIKDINQEVPDFLEELYKWSLESVALVGLDARLGCLDRNVTADSDGQKLIQSVQTQFKLMNKMEGFLGNVQFWKLFRTPTWRKFEKVADEFSEIAFKYINRSCEELKKKDKTDDLTLLQALLATEGLEVGGALVTVADMLFGGIDTTAHTAGFLLYELAKNQDKQELLYQEVNQHLSSSGGRITPAVFSELRYLKACLKESLRLHPIIPVGARELDHDVVISGFRVPSKTTIVVMLAEICLEEKYFTNAAQFLPERWLKKEEKFNPFSYLPFGFGPRMCLGKRLAETEMICLIAEIIHRFKLEYHHEDIGILTKFIYTPDKPLRFTFIERK